MGAIQRHGRAARIREVLVHFPAGATVAQIIAAGGIKATAYAVGKSLVSMREQDQVVMSMGNNRLLWALAPRLRQAMAAMIGRSVAGPRCPPSMPRFRADDSATTIRHREKDRQALAAQLAAFQKAGGRIEVLGNTPIRPSRTRREVIQGTGSAARRSAGR